MRPPAALAGLMAKIRALLSNFICKKSSKLDFLLSLQIIFLLVFYTFKRVLTDILSPKNTFYSVSLIYLYCIVFNKLYQYVYKLYFSYVKLT